MILGLFSRGAHPGPATTVACKCARISARTMAESKAERYRSRITSEIIKHAERMESYSTFWNPIWKFSLLCLVFCGYGMYDRRAARSSNRKISERLKAGSNPWKSKRLNYTIPRPDVVESIQGLFKSDTDIGKIGVVLGPTGSGKTQATIIACSTPCSTVPLGPNYILYKQIYMNSEVAEQLAHAADMQLTRNIFDKIFNSLGVDSQAFFPEDSDKAITYVLNKVARRSKEAIKGDSLKHLPCFVIDAAELLAVHKPDLLDTLLRLGQYYARAKKLRIILVDSDGITLAKINENLKHPIVDVVEVGDLSDEDALRYLIERTKLISNEMSNILAKRLVSLIGGRLLHLNCAIDKYQKLETSELEDLELAYKRIKEYLYIKVMVPISNIIISNAPLSELIVKCVISNNFDPLYLSDLKKHMHHVNKGTDLAKLQEVIDILVKANLLRYNADGQLLLHSKFVKEEIENMYRK